MALYSSVSLNPANISLDPTVVNRFSWVNRGSQTTSFTLTLLNNNDNTVIYTNTVISSNSYFDLPANTLTSGLAIKWNVTVYNGSQSASSLYAYITTNSPATLTFIAPDFSGATPILNTQDYTFITNFSQSQNISISQFRFVLYDSIGVNIIDDSGWIYGFTPEWTFKGMLRNTQYQIIAYAIGQDGLQCNTGLHIFSIINYVLPDTTPVISVIENNNNASITTNWSSLKIVQPTTSGSYSFVSGKFNLGLLLDDTSTITYHENFDLNNNTLTGWFQFPYSKDGDFAYLGLNISFGFDYASQRFYINNNGTYTYSQQFGLYDLTNFNNDTLGSFTGDLKNPGFVPLDLTGHWFFISIIDSNRIILYFNNIKVIDITTGNIVGVSNVFEFTGKLLLDNIHLQDISLTTTQVDSINKNIPQIWGIYTNWLADYEGNLGAGNISNGVVITGWRLRRKKLTDSLFEIVGDFPFNTRTYTDLTVVNKQTYIYDVFSLDVNGNEGLGIEGQASTNFWGWFLINPTTQEYLKFDSGLGKSLNTDAIKINRDYNLYKNFTLYPSISYGKLKYKSSKIQCFPYLFDSNCNIVNDLDLLNKCENMIESGSILILKNAKGEIFYVNTHDFDYKYTDEVSEQPFYISFEWTVVADKLT